MTSATCPACGVTVLPGYAKCPKCKAPLPYGSGHVVAGGGTAVSDQKLPVLPLLAVGLVLIGGIAFFALRKSSPDKPVAPAAPIASGQVVPPPVAPPPTAPAAVETQPIARTPSSGAAAAQLETVLKKQRLWSTVTVIGDRADIRSNTCDDPQMAPTVDAAAPALRAAGLTRLRCLEQSGRVAFERAL